MQRVLNLPPKATDDRDATLHDTPLAISMADLLANDPDPDGNLITVASLGKLSDPESGILLILGGLVFLCHPEPGFVGNVTGNTAIQVIAGNLPASDNDPVPPGGGTFVANIHHNTLTHWWGNAIHVVAQGNATGTAAISDNTVHQTSGALAGSGGIWVSGGALTYEILRNSVRYTNGTAISADRLKWGTTMKGTISSNTIGVSGEANSGSEQGVGIFASHAGPGTTTVLISNNIIRQINGTAAAIWVIAGDASTGGGSGTMNATVLANNIQEAGTTVANARMAILVTHGRQSTPVNDTDVGCYDILNNTITNFNMDSPSESQNRIRVNQRFGTTSRWPGYTGAAMGPTSAADMATYLLSRNTASNSSNANSSTVGFFNTVPPGSDCPRP